MNQNLKELVQISNFYGADAEFVLAGGGNTSLKSDEFLFVKASGTALSTINENGFVKMDRSKMEAMWSKTYPADPKKREAAVLEDLLECRTPGEEQKRPSVEALLHHLMAGKYVVHTHPAVVNGLTCAKDAKTAVPELFGDQAIWLPYTDPGYILAVRVKKALAGYFSLHKRQAQVLLLQNHGLFVCANSIREIKSITNNLVRRLCQKLVRSYDYTPIQFDTGRAAGLAVAIRMMVKSKTKQSCSVCFTVNREIHTLVQNRAAFYPVSSAYTPDHIVYYRPRPLFITYKSNPDKQYQEIGRALDDYFQKHGFYPKIIAIQKLGIFAVSESKQTAGQAFELFLDAVKISVYNQNFGGPKFMSQSQIQFISNWEAEFFRKKVAGGAVNRGPCQEKVAVVTGGAQGFGKGIADALLAAGAHVTIADINYGLACRVAEDFCVRYGKKRAMAVRTDVMKKEDVGQMIHQTVLNYGGLDILISNAGILKAGSLKEMDDDAFQLMTEINYKAFFLCAKYASEIMRLQHQFDNTYYTDIIQINSKSGLSGSKKNFAYAGAKFGGIGLVQSFALELVDYKVKVNAICPGNLFDGPLWSHPTKGLFVQYLNSNKVPGAKTIQDVKRYYEDKVPMKRGCAVEDVVKALFYIIDQKYETGQALPVTGGQIMLH